MNKLILKLSKGIIGLVLICFSTNTMSQAPDKFSYQAVIRDNNNNLLTNQTIGIQISILKGSVNGFADYVETQTPTTNANGLVSIEIGDNEAVVISGSLPDIDWSAGPYYLKVETDPSGGTDYSISSVSQLLSVPYALFAGSVKNTDDADADPENELQDISLSGKNLSISKGSTVTLPVGNSPWDSSLSVLYYSKGNVGIGTSLANSKLSVGGSGVSTYAITGTGSNGIYGLTGESGFKIGVSGAATNPGDYENYGGYFTASGATGRGVYSYASNSGEYQNYGGYFISNGAYGRGVYGYASNAGSYTNYGGYFVASGMSGRGVYGNSSGSTGSGVYGYSTGILGFGVYGYATGESATGIRAYSTGSSGFGVTAYGVLYDFYADGPGTNYGSASSIRWKNNITAIDSVLYKIKNLRGVYFNWDEEHGGGHDLGFIAEEVGRYFPECVTFDPDDSEYAHGMDYGKMTPVLLQAIKEQQKLIDTLKDNLETQNNLIEELTTRIEALESK